MKPSNLLSLLFFLPVTLFAGPLSTEDFSLAEDKHAGAPIHPYPGWYAVPAGGGLVTSDDWVTVGQSLVLVPGYPVTEVARELPPSVDPLYIEVWVRPVFGETLESFGIEAEGALVRFVLEGGLGVIVAGELPGASSLAAPVFGTLESGLSAQWIRIGLELDRAAEEWALALDGKVVLEGVPFSRISIPGEIVFSGDSQYAVYVDALTFADEPLQEFDTGATGDRENQPMVDDDAPSPTRISLTAEIGGKADEGKTGVSDAGEIPTLADALNTVFVDNAVGHDTFDGGAAAIEGGGRGPVASLAAALTRVSDGGTIVIHEGNSVYTGDLTHLNGKRVNVQTVGNVRVRSLNGS